MSQKERRLDKVEGSLTGRQIAMLWFQEANRYPNMFELARSLLGQPVGAFPIPTLTERVERSVESAMKGKPLPAIAQAMRRELRDVYFLFNLHQNVNAKALDQLQVWHYRGALVAERLRAMRMENAFRSLIEDMAEDVSMEMPYPLDPETAAAVDAAIKHHVTTWEQLDEDGTIETWLFDHLVKQGATELPDSAYEYHDGECTPRVNADNEAEIRACFKDEAQFERFKAGKDYSYGLADVTDEEYSAHYHRISMALQELMDSGQVEAGTLVTFETVPIPFLREAPLVDGEWLDAKVVEFARWGALLAANGYQLQDDEDAHPLSIGPILAGDGTKADVGESEALKNMAASDTARFPGRAKEIDGRRYVHFENCRAWLEREGVENVCHLLHEGMVTASWNAWVQANGGKADVAGVRVDNLCCYIESRQYHVCPQGAEAMLGHRERLLDEMRGLRRKPDRDAALCQDWKGAAEDFLAELYSFREAVASVSVKYFDGQTVLFSDVARDLDKVITDTEELVKRFNSDFGGEAGLALQINLAAVLQNAGESSTQPLACLIDLAKAEALTDLGEQQSAAKLVERYV
ncbi:MAG: hypothetical protein NTU41_05730 [Chloroflexi bacterium]|nr:hypothetical protein [Chloroflexota bacterium]